MLLGHGHYGFKMSVIVIALLVMFFSLTNITYRVSAKATIEGWTQRHISAAIDGYILESFAKAGDVVEKGAFSPRHD